MPRPKLTPEQMLVSFEKRREQIKKYNKKYFDARKGTPEWKEKCKEYYENRKNKKNKKPKENIVKCCTECGQKIKRPQFPLEPQ